VCRFLLFSLFQRSRWRLSVGSTGFYVLDSVLKPITGVELSNEVFTSRARWMPLTVEWNTFANMFYLLKNFLLLIHVIFKLKCNDLSFNEIIMLNALYVCLHAFSLSRESPNPDPKKQTPHFWGGSVTICSCFVRVRHVDGTCELMENRTSHEDPVSWLKWSLCLLILLLQTMKKQSWLI
jgi:hypothetical protein